MIQNIACNLVFPNSPTFLWPCYGHIQNLKVTARKAFLCYERILNSLFTFHSVIKTIITKHSDSFLFIQQRNPLMILTL
jgi:hypothetical protein